MADFRRGYTRIAFLTGLALLCIATGIEYFQYKRSQNLILRELQYRLDECAMNKTLKSKTIQGSLFLINKKHRILASNQPEHYFSTRQGYPSLELFLSSAVVHKIDQEIKHPSRKFFFDKSSLLYVSPLPTSPLFLVYIGSKSELFQQVFTEALEDIFVIVSILIFVVGASYIVVIRDFISPAQQLITHIAKENKGEESHPQNIPQRWQPWFDIVSRIFKENRTLLTTLENRVKLRTKQLQQKNQQLEKTLTNLKKAQNQIIAQEKLANLGSLTAGIAHEIKNPLNFILNFSDLSLEYLYELKEKVSNKNDLFTLIEQNLIKTHEHAERADSIVKGMLAHARNNTGTMTTFNLSWLLDKMIEFAYLGFQRQEKGFTCKITKKFDSHIGEIQGAEQDLGRVFMNIVNNACFAMHEKQEKLGGSYTPELHITTQDKGEMIEITFKDNGPGISQRIIKKIFNPFFTTKDSGKGTGLGLSISHDIITHQHHGQLMVDSKVGHYTQFKIKIPKKTTITEV